MDRSGFEIDTSPTLSDERLQLLYDYWHRLAQEAGGLPAVRAFDPLHLPKLLANLWILEVAPDTHRFRMRLAGENINVIYRRNIAGHYFSEVFEASEVELAVGRYTRALNEPSIVRAIGAVYALSHGERLALPMLGRSGVTDTMFGVTFYNERLTVTAPIHVMDNEPTFYPLRRQPPCTTDRRRMSVSCAAPGRPRTH